MKISARQSEMETLNAALMSDKPEFLAVYGRRRVGKTFLIREFFRQEPDIFYLESTGQKNATMRKQIDHFCYQIETAFSLKLPIQRPATWSKLFRFVNELLKNRSEKHLVLFFDELPWLAGPRSGFIQALEHCWNQWWSSDARIKLIVCGSAASWMHDHIISAQGGLHNRLTRQILLRPFSFNEVKEYLTKQKIRLADKEILKLYLVFGGVPYYWSLLTKGKSASQLVDDLYFQKDGDLRYEFDNLFRSLFDDYQIHERIVRVLGSRKHGMLRNEILAGAKLNSGGTANKYLQNLELSGFIESFTPFGRLRKETSYRLIDEFCLFHLFWEARRASIDSFWQNEMGSPTVNTWSGYAFENFCLQHRDLIIDHLKIRNLVLGLSSWQIRSERKSSSIGAQIDLLIIRTDGPIHICEIKYSNEPYCLDKATARSIATKVESFRSHCKFKGQIFVNLITANGHRSGLWDEEILDGAINLGSSDVGKKLKPREK